MGLFETHFHFDASWDAEKYYQDSLSAGIEYLLAVGGDEPTTKTAAEFANKFSNSFFSAGVHPHDAADYLSRISNFEQYYKAEKCVAVGEIGLDYFYENSDRNAQKKIFKIFLEMALKYNLPAIIHCRDKADCDDAYKDCYQALSEYALKSGHFVIHCYTGSIEWAKKFIDLGAYIGFTGIITFPRAQNVRDVLKIIPLERIVVETDTPYLAPVPFRGKINHSKYLPEIIAYIAKERNIGNDEMIEITKNNALELFRI